MSVLTKKKLSIYEKCLAYTRADDVKAQGIYPYFRPIQEGEGAVVKMEGKDVIMAGSNNYLGLTTHPKVKNAAVDAIQKYGTSCSGSRYLTGTIDLHESLEARLASFVNMESALLFSTGYQAGQGVITSLLSRGDQIIADKDNHASIVAGNLISAAMGVQVLRYKHNNVADFTRVMEKSDTDTNRLIVTDGVFSTFGDIANLDEIVKQAKKHNALTLVDDAHGLGVLGKGGRGTVSEFGLDVDVDLVVCTFSKTLASLGGFVAGKERVINYLKHHSPALIFSASPTPPSVAAASAALDILIKEPQRVDRLVNNARIIRDGLTEMGYHVTPGRTAIVPVIIGDDDKAFELWKELYQNGIFVNVFISPATPPGKAMMRNSFMATHEEAHLQKVLDVYKKAGGRLGII